MPRTCHVTAEADAYIQGGGSKGAFEGVLGGIKGAFRGNRANRAHRVPCQWEPHMSALENVLIFDKLNMWSEMRSFNGGGREQRSVVSACRTQATQSPLAQSP